MADKKIILNTLTFLKAQGDKLNEGVNIKEDFQEFKELHETDQERIRDRLVINRYASFPTQGDQWKLAITWHPNGGVDLLKKPKWAINKDGNLRNIYKGWKHLQEHSLTIITSVISGLVLFFLIDIYIKPKFNTNNKVKKLDPVDSTYSDSNMNSTDKIDTTPPDSVAISAKKK